MTVVFDEDVLILILKVIVTTNIYFLTWVYYFTWVTSFNPLLSPFEVDIDFSNILQMTLRIENLGDAPNFTQLKTAK